MQEDGAGGQNKAKIRRCSARCCDFQRRSFGLNELAVLDDDDAAGTSSHSSHLDGRATLSLPGFIGSIHGNLA